MVQVSEATKKVILFIIVALCLYLVVFLTSTLLFRDKEEVLEIDEEINDLLESDEDLEEVEDILEEIEETAQLEKKVLEVETKPDYIQKGSMRISLEDVYLDGSEDEGYEIFFKVKGEDMIMDDDLSKEAGNFYFRSALSWNAILVYYVKDRRPLLVCDSTNDGRFWYTTYCIGVGDLTESYFGQTIRLVYTDMSLPDIEDVSPISLSKQERTFVFEVRLPKEFYKD